MKKIIFAAMTVMVCGFANAQGVKIGVKGGLNVSNFTGDLDGIDVGYQTGFNAGGFVEIKLSDKLVVQPEILFSMQGAEFKNGKAYVEGKLVTGSANFILNYVNVPVMFKYSLVKNFSIEVGPQIGFLASAKTKTVVNGYSGKHEMDVKKIFESTDFGLNLGAGYDFTENFSVGVRYNLGLSNILKTKFGDDSKLHNGVLSFLAAYKF